MICSPSNLALHPWNPRCSPSKIAFLRGKKSFFFSLKSQEELSRKTWWHMCPTLACESLRHDAHIQRICFNCDSVPNICTLLGWLGWLRPAEWRDLHATPVQQKQVSCNNGEVLRELRALLCDKRGVEKRVCVWWGPLKEQMGALAPLLWWQADIPNAFNGSEKKSLKKNARGSKVWGSFCHVVDEAELEDQPGLARLTFAQIKPRTLI